MTTGETLSSFTVFLEAVGAAGLELDLSDTGAVIFKGKGKKPDNLAALLEARGRFGVECLVKLRHHENNPLRFETLGGWMIEDNITVSLKDVSEVAYNPLDPSGVVLMRGRLHLLTSSPEEWERLTLLGHIEALITVSGQVLPKPQYIPRPIQLERPA